MDAIPQIVADQRSQGCIDPSRPFRTCVYVSIYIVYILDYALVRLLAGGALAEPAHINAHHAHAACVRTFGHAHKLIAY